jgi:hypothetical protein
VPRTIVPAPQKAPTASGANTNQNGPAVTNATTTTAADVAAVTEGVEDAFITSRTFDLYWVDKTALMYKDGYVKVSFLVYGVILLVNWLGCVVGVLECWYKIVKRGMTLTLSIQSNQIPITTPPEIRPRRKTHHGRRQATILHPHHPT